MYIYIYVYIRIYTYIFHYDFTSIVQYFKPWDCLLSSARPRHRGVPCTSLQSSRRGTLRPGGVVPMVFPMEKVGKVARINSGFQDRKHGGFTRKHGGFCHGDVEKMWKNPLGISRKNSQQTHHESYLHLVQVSSETCHSRP